MINERTTLYRHYDADGVLLYVGISLSALSRLGQHKQNAHWFTKISSQKMEHFDTRKEALAAEKRAIKTERPLYNIQHKTTNGTAHSSNKFGIEAYTMTFERGTIVKSDELINASYNLTLNELRIVNLAISMIDRTRSFCDNKEIRIHAKDMKEAYNFENDPFSSLKAGVSKIADKIVVFPNGEKAKWVDESYYIEKEGTAVIRFSPEIVKHFAWLPF